MNRYLFVYINSPQYYGYKPKTRLKSIKPVRVNDGHA